MSKTKTILCLDCDSTVKLRDKHEELEAEAIKFCPICGSDNIEVSKD